MDASTASEPPFQQDSVESAGRDGRRQEATVTLAAFVAACGGGSLGNAGKERPIDAVRHLCRFFTWQALLRSAFLGHGMSVAAATVAVLDVTHAHVV